MMRWTSFPYHHISDYIRANVTRSVREAGAEDRGEETNQVQAMEMEAISAGSGQLACGGRYHDNTDSQWSDSVTSVASPTKGQGFI